MVLHHIWYLVLGFAVIVFSAELFTNGIEWLGQRLSLSEGVVGSILAALGTAMPETLVPLVAIFFFGHRQGAQIGMGAIAGSPFMLTTLTMAVTGIAILWSAKLNLRGQDISANQTIIKRDLRLFIENYAIAILATFASGLPIMRYFVAIFLFARYLRYVHRAFKHEGEVGQSPEKLHFDRLAGLGSERLRLILPQMLVGLYGIVFGARLIVAQTESLSLALGLPAYLLALIISPMATELPEQVNAVLWTRKGKDTLALGNITGSLVFQSSFPVAFGIAFTDWHLPPSTVLVALITLLLACAYFILLERQKLKALHLLAGALVYAATIAILVSLNLKIS